MLLGHLRRFYVYYLCILNYLIMEMSPFVWYPISSTAELFTQLRQVFLQVQ